MWGRAGYPAVAVGRYRDAAEEIKWLQRENERLREALQLIVDQTVCPELFPDVDDPQSNEMAYKTALVIATAALEPGEMSREEALEQSRPVEENDGH